MKRERLATAEWADPEEFARTHPFRVGDFFIGRSPVTGEALGYSDDRHVGLFSGNRSGKGTTTIIPNLCLWPGSLVAVDPKGENATLVAARRGPGSKYCEGLGQWTYVLDPFNVATVDESLRGRFNPLDALDPGHPEVIDEAAMVAETLVPKNPEVKDAFFDNNARSLVKALILHLISDPRFDKRRNLVTLRQLLMRGDVETVELLKGMGETDVGSGHEHLYQGMINNGAFGGLVAGEGQGALDLLHDAAKLHHSVLKTATEATIFLDSPTVQKCVEASDFDLADLKRDPKGVSVFLCLPDRRSSEHYRWLRMMIGLVVTELEKVKGQPACGHRVLMCLDEFAMLGRMEVIEKAIGYMAGFGMKIFFILQDLVQLKSLYKDRWESFLNNAGLKIFFGNEDHTTCEYVSKFLGDTQLNIDTRSRSESLSDTQGVSEAHGRSLSASASRNTGQSLSVNRGSSTSTSAGYNAGTSENTGWQDSRQDGQSWNGDPWLMQIPASMFSLMRVEEKINSSRGHSLSGGTATNSGFSLNKTAGTNTGVSASVNSGESTSLSASNSYTFTSNASQTRQTSASVNETIHKRPLISPDEFRIAFAPLTNRGNPWFPGLALVIASGCHPAFVRRSNYYDDPLCDGLYDPHPDHPESTPPPLVTEREVFGPPGDLISFVQQRDGSVSIGTWLVKVGDRIEQGNSLCTVTGVRSADAIPLVSPIAGTLSRVVWERGPLTARCMLATIKGCRRQPDYAGPDPLNEHATYLREEDRLAEVERVRQRVEQAALRQKIAAVERRRDAASEEVHALQVSCPEKPWWKATGWLLAVWVVLANVSEKDRSPHATLTFFVYVAGIACAICLLVACALSCVKTARIDRKHKRLNELADEIRLLEDPTATPAVQIETSLNQQINSFKSPPWLETAMGWIFVGLFVATISYCWKNSTGFLMGAVYVVLTWLASVILFAVFAGAFWLVLYIRLKIRDAA